MNEDEFVEHINRKYKVKELFAAITSGNFLDVVGVYLEMCQIAKLLEDRVGELKAENETLKQELSQYISRGEVSILSTNLIARAYEDKYREFIDSHKASED